MSPLYPVVLVAVSEQSQEIISSIIDSSFRRCHHNRTGHLESGGSWIELVVLKTLTGERSVGKGSNCYP